MKAEPGIGSLLADSGWSNKARHHFMTLKNAHPAERFYLMGKLSYEIKKRTAKPSSGKIAVFIEFLSMLP